LVLLPVPNIFFGRDVNQTSIPNKITKNFIEPIIFNELDNPENSEKTPETPLASTKP